MIKKVLPRCTYRIHISGQVQGVGFRPLVYRIAHHLQLKGCVNNSTDGVHIEVSGPPDAITGFITQVQKQKPVHAVIDHISVSEVPYTAYNKFLITESQNIADRAIKITPDIAICKNCTAELVDVKNRRFAYPFITCTRCGPRYSVQDRSPYDRRNTSMTAFQMCHSCQEEYDKPADERFYSQTNSCETCGIALSISCNENNIDFSAPEIIGRAVDFIQKGKIVAVKGIGGFLLLCDASNRKAIDNLRKRKNRLSKPFAVLYPDLASVRKDVAINDEETQALQSPVSPIVLLRLKPSGKKSIKADVVAPGLQRVGVMLPYAPLLFLISRGFGKPLVATSANVSDAPIVFENDEANRRLSDLADVIVSHNRDIANPQDDSVVQFAGKQSIIVRRSRGIAPSYFGPISQHTVDGIVAFGADMKSSISLVQSRNWYVSQYMGALDSYEAQLNYQRTLDHFLSLTSCKPSVILADKHPDYFTGYFAKRYSERQGLPLHYIQHHEAHFAAVLQENNLIDEDEAVLGVIWDGTGAGNDGNSWGGEFFDYSNGVFTRVSHLSYVASILGDKMAREPRISALVYGHSTGQETDPIIRNKFSTEAYRLYNKMCDQATVFTSSMGRLFDAVASMSGLIDLSTYEGQAALYLEEVANTAKGLSMKDAYPVKFSENSTIDTKIIIGEILSDLRMSIPPAIVALKFHYTAVAMVRALADGKGYSRIAFSGGVFQNSLLVRLIIEELSEDYKLFFHKELSPNDENVSFGQLAHYHNTASRVCSVHPPSGVHSG
jgi:hydrogenase maturation protein HypF